MKTRKQIIRKSLNNTFDPYRGSLAGTLAMATLFAFGKALFAQQQDQPRKPMQATLEDGAEYRWLNKTVIESRLLDNMENLATWSFKGEGEMTLSAEHKKDGEHSLKIESTFNIARVDGSGEWEDLVATRKFPSEDWRKYNRISLWVYANVAGAPALAASERHEGTCDRRSSGLRAARRSERGAEAP